MVWKSGVCLIKGSPWWWRVAETSHLVGNSWLDPELAWAQPWHSRRLQRNQVRSIVFGVDYWSTCLLGGLEETVSITSSCFSGFTNREDKPSFMEMISLNFSCSVWIFPCCLNNSAQCSCCNILQLAADLRQSPNIVQTSFSHITWRFGQTFEPLE